MDEVAVERVLRAVEAIPRGRVAAYGDIGGIVGTGPRQVGWVMRHYGGNVPWWRVTNAYGDLPAPLREEARVRWAEEGILVKPSGPGCRITDHRADLGRLAAAYDRSVADLPEPGLTGRRPGQH
ncbi:MAG: MGMT family protein [Dermatophilaceae bacterium]